MKKSKPAVNLMRSDRERIESLERTASALEARLSWLQSEEGQRAIAIFRKAIKESRNSTEEEQP
jgi:hypothetical protein